MSDAPPPLSSPAFLRGRMKEGVFAFFAVKISLVAALLCCVTAVKPKGSLSEQFCLKRLSALHGQVGKVENVIRGNFLRDTFGLAGIADRFRDQARVDLAIGCFDSFVVIVDL